MAWIEPVTNRSRGDMLAVIDALNKNWDDFSDVDKTVFLAGMRGALNTGDLERVQNNIGLLLEVIESENTVMAVPEFPNTAFYTNIKDNLQTLYDFPLVYGTTPKVPELPYNTWQKWNDIEKILADAYKMVNSFVKYYCNTAYHCGAGIDVLE